jgi:hypothetical protein
MARPRYDWGDIAFTERNRELSRNTTLGRPETGLQQISSLNFNDIQGL